MFQFAFFDSSRLYYNTTDVKCREDYYLGNNVKCSNETPSQQPMPQLTPNHQHAQHQLHINQNTHSHQLQSNQQTTACSPSSGIEAIDDGIDCALYSNTTGNGRVVAATQTHMNNANVASCEQMSSHTPVSLVPVNVPVPPVMYTVHRVVTTAQIQTAAGSTFASSASVSSVVSASRNESDCMASAQVTSAMSMSANDTCHSGLHISDLGGNIVTNGNSLGPPTGVRSSSGNVI